MLWTMINFERYGPVGGRMFSLPMTNRLIGVSGGGRLYQIFIDQEPSSEVMKRGKEVVGTPAKMSDHPLSQKMIRMMAEFHRQT